TVFATANVGNTEQAYLYGASGSNTFVGAMNTPTTTSLASAGFSIQASGFQTVTASGNGGTADRAYFYGSQSGGNTLVGTPTYSSVKSAGRVTTAAGFTAVSAFGGTAVGSTSGSDLALLFDSAGSDLFLGTPTYSYFQTGAVLNIASGFPSVRASSGGG